MMTAKQIAATARTPVWASSAAISPQPPTGATPDMTYSPVVFDLGSGALNRTTRIASTQLDRKDNHHTVTSAPAGRPRRSGASTGVCGSLARTTSASTVWGNQMFTTGQNQPPIAQPACSVCRAAHRVCAPRRAYQNHAMTAAPAPTSRNDAALPAHVSECHCLRTPCGCAQ